MMHRHATKRLRHLALDYVLGFLPAEKAAAMALHLETGCLVCEREVRANRHLVDLLAMHEGAGKPPPALRERVLSVIAADVHAPSRSVHKPDTGPASIPAGWTVVRGGADGWSPSQGRAARVKPLSHNQADGTRVVLIRVGAGGHYPRFLTAGTMELYVVEGALFVNGKRLDTGDYCAAPARTVLSDMESPYGCRFILLRSEHERAREERNPAVSSNVIIVRASEGRWLPTRVQGITTKPLFTDPTRGTQTYLVRALPGSRMPPHRHRSADQTFFLEGDGRVGTMVFEAGDYYHAAAGTFHDESWTEHGCLCLTLAARSDASE